MKKFINNKLRTLITLLAVVTLMASCQDEEEVAAVMDPSVKPTLTVTRIDDLGASVQEGSMLKFEVKTDKMFKRYTDMSIVVNSDSDAGSADFEVLSATRFPAYTESIIIDVMVLDDNFPEMTETLSIMIGALNGEHNWQFNPDSDLMKTFQVEIMNVNNPELITVAFAWEDPEHVHDFDLLIESETYGSWSADGATSSNPEIDMTIYNVDPDGTFYAGVDPYHVENGDIPFSVHVGHPDGSVEIFEGVWNNDLVGEYPTTPFSAWGIDMYKLVTIDKTGSNYDVTYNF